MQGNTFDRCGKILTLHAVTTLTAANMSLLGKLANTGVADMRLLYTILISISFGYGLDQVR